MCALPFGNLNSGNSGLWCSVGMNAHAEYAKGDKSPCDFYDSPDGLNQRAGRVRPKAVTRHYPLKLWNSDPASEASSAIFFHSRVGGAKRNPSSGLPAFSA